MTAAWRAITKGHAKIACLFLILLACFVLSFTLGRYPVAPGDLVRVLASRIVPMDKAWSDAAETVILHIRLPRIIAAVLIGAALSGAGTAYQSLFQNPMVSPDVLGASAGAGFGAALGITLSFGSLGISLCAFAFGIAAVGAAYFISTRAKYGHVLGLVLAGIMMGSLFSSGVSYLKLIADTEDTLPSITYWLMGSLNSIREEDLLFAAVPVFMGMVLLLLLRWRLNILAMGEDEAKSLGIHTGRIRLVVVVCATVMTSACVAISGMIGWVGLVIPHAARMMVGNDNRFVLPAAMITGAGYLLITDNFARLLSSSEIPLGILTSFVGAPFFLFLMMRRR